MDNLLLSPPVTLCVFLATAYGLYLLGGALMAQGQEHPGKHQPYACGEDLLPRTQLAYHGFFRLALMFGVLHMAALVISTLSSEPASRRMAMAYLVGVGVSVLVLTQRER